MADGKGKTVSNHQAVYIYTNICIYIYILYANAPSRLFLIAGTEIPSGRIGCMHDEKNNPMAQRSFAGCFCSHIHLQCIYIYIHTIFFKYLDRQIDG